MKNPTALEEHQRRRRLTEREKTLEAINYFHSYFETIPKTELDYEDGVTIVLPDLGQATIKILSKFLDAYSFQRFFVFVSDKRDDRDKRTLCLNFKLFEEKETL